MTKSLISAVVVLLTPVTLFAYGSGITGYSGNPAQGSQTCLACHGGGITPTVTLTGPSMVSPGSVNTYILTISGGQQMYGGLDVSATGGLFAVASSDVRVQNGEVTHTAPKAAASGNVNFSFQWTAPNTAGTYVLYGDGNSTNGTGTFGDASALANLAVTVASSMPTPTPAPTPAPTVAPTPTPAQLTFNINLSAPSRVRLKSADPVAVNLVIAGSATGGVPNSSLSAVAYFYKNSTLISSQNISVNLDATGAGSISASDASSISLTDVGSIGWSAVVKYSATSSNTASVTTVVRKAHGL